MSSSALTTLRLKVWMPPGTPHRSVSSATTCLLERSKERGRLSETSAIGRPSVSRAGRLGRDDQSPWSRPMDSILFESLPDRLDGLRLEQLLLQHKLFQLFSVCCLEPLGKGKGKA